MPYNLTDSNNHIYTTKEFIKDQIKRPWIQLPGMNLN